MEKLVRLQDAVSIPIFHQCLIEPVRQPVIPVSHRVVDQLMALQCHQRLNFEFAEISSWNRCEWRVLRKVRGQKRQKSTICDAIHLICVNDW
jgi:hypothetical protein